MSKFSLYAILFAAIALAVIPAFTTKEVKKVSESDAVVLRNLEPSNQNSLQKNLQKEAVNLRVLKKSYKKAFIAFLVLFIIFFIILLRLE